MIIYTEQCSQVIQRRTQQMNGNPTVINTADAALQQRRETNNMHMKYLPFFLQRNIGERGTSNSIH